MFSRVSALLIAQDDHPVISFCSEATTGSSTRPGTFILYSVRGSSRLFQAKQPYQGHIPSCLNPNLWGYYETDMHSIRGAFPLCSWYLTFQEHISRDESLKNQGAVSHKPPVHEKMCENVWPCMHLITLTIPPEESKNADARLIRRSDLIFRDQRMNSE